jgi:hypothetical protein
MAQALRKTAQGASQWIRLDWARRSRQLLGAFLHLIIRGGGDPASLSLRHRLCEGALIDSKGEL